VAAEANPLPPHDPAALPAPTPDAHRCAGLLVELRHGLGAPKCVILLGSLGVVIERDGAQGRPQPLC
jgi:hypothetical protein